MARAINKLDVGTVRAEERPGHYADGAGLYLQVSGSGSKSWVFRFRRRRRAREMGLGSLLAISLAQARRRAAHCRTLLANGVDPINARDEGTLDWTQVLK
ncbi:MAG: hypothetical protein JWO88_3616 [Frankiales bacterium]|nr:hypothetical protein [Frankiales bacterium]